VIYPAEDTRRKTEKRKDLLQSLMDNVPDYIFFKDTGSRYIRINEALRKEMGLRSSDEIVGKTDADFFSPEMTDLFHNTDHDIFEKGTHQSTRLWKQRLRTAGPCGLSTTKMPIRNDKNEIIGLVASHAT
jgi:PAS domain S-box-containing protein